MLKNAYLIFIVSLLTACAGTTQEVIHSEDISFIGKIQQGGYVIFFRHAATDQSQKDTNITNLADCDSQRRLDGLGRTQAKVIGKSFKKLKIPVGEVITSHYCRCMNTAKLAFGRATPADDITSFVGVTKMERTRRITALKQMLNVAPQPGTNTVIVGHKYMFKEAAGVLLEEGEAAIFRPDGSGSTQFIAQVKPNEWQQVGNHYSRM